MADSISQDKRSEDMKKIMSKNTQPEIIIRKYLFSKGLRFRIHSKELAGKQDIVLKKFKTIIFVNGCFWHEHKGCKNVVLPKNRLQFWEDKIERIEKEILKKKFAILRLESYFIYECQLQKTNFEKLIIQIKVLIKAFTFLKVGY